MIILIRGITILVALVVLFGFPVVYVYLISLDADAKFLDGPDPLFMYVGFVYAQGIILFFAGKYLTEFLDKRKARADD